MLTLSERGLHWGATEAQYEPAEHYHARSGLSGSKLKDLHRAPELFYRKHISREAADKSTAAMDLGIAVHEDVLVSAVQRGWKIIPSEVLSKSGAKSGNAWKEWRDLPENQGVPLLKEAEADKLRCCIAALQSNTTAMELITLGGNGDGLPNQATAELSVCGDVSWLDPAGELHHTLIRGRIDYLPTPEVIVDLKTTYDLDPGRFARRARFELGYDIQGGVYRRLVHQMTSLWPEVYFVVVETSEPYRCDVFKLDRPREADAKVERLVVEYFRRAASGWWQRDYAGEILLL